MSARTYAELVARTEWLKRYTQWATDFCVKGPRWIPLRVRKMPLNFWAFVLRGYVRGWW